MLSDLFYARSTACTRRRPRRRGDPVRNRREAQISPLSPRGRGLGCGGGRMMRIVCHERAHAARQQLSFASPKESHQRKGDPDIRPVRGIARFEAKTSRGPKLAALKQRTAGLLKCATFSLQISGANTRGTPSSQFLIAAQCGLREPGYEPSN